MSGFQRKKFEGRVAFLSLDKLSLHEDVIPELERRVRAKLRRQGYLSVPLIVDEGSLAVLDGTHRTEALKKLGCRKAAVLLVDYLDPKIKLGRWYRCLKVIPSKTNFLKTLKEVPVNLKKLKGNPVSGEEKEKPSVVLRDEAYLVDVGSIEAALGAVYRIEEALRRSHYRVSYRAEKEAEKMLRKGRISAFISPPLLSKEDVLEAAARGLRFQPKSTRHILPFKPPKLNIPLEALY